MTTRREIFRFFFIMAALAMIRACGAPEDSSADSAGSTQLSTSSDEPERNLTTTAIIRPANAYQLEWDHAEPLCQDGLTVLNKPFAPAGEPLAEDAQDYASLQAIRYLGAGDNIQWRTEDTPAPGADKSEIAAFDYFNDGIERTVRRLRGKLAGNSIITLGVVPSGNDKTTLLSFGHAGALFENLPDQTNLNTKLTYSVSDVVKLPEGYYTLLMPLEDVDGSGRVYLALWRAKDETAPPRTPADYYSELACVFKTDAASMASPE